VKTGPRLPNPGQLLHDLQHNQELRHQPVLATELDPPLALLRKWQSERLAHTYADLLADKRYRPACLFFLSDIYAPRDFSQRDHDVERIHAFLSRVVPAPMLQLLTDVVELNSLTQALDRKLVDVLVNKLNVTGAITPELYAEGYRICDNYAERVRQIDLITRVVAQVGEGARLRGVGTAMKLVGGPARRAGWAELYGFLERGYDAFRQMRDVRLLCQLVEQRGASRPDLPGSLILCDMNGPAHPRIGDLRTPARADRRSSRPTP
jgi:hypothetical protein